MDWLKEINQWIITLTATVGAITGLIYAIFRKKTDKKNGGNWRKMLHDIKTKVHKNSEIIDNVNLKLDAHINESKDKYKEIKDEMQHIKKHTDKCCKGNK